MFNIYIKKDKEIRESELVVVIEYDNDGVIIKLTSLRLSKTACFING